MEERKKQLKEEKVEKEKPRWKKAEREEKKMKEETLIRILSTDIPGHMNIYAGLTKVKGISWSFSNATCKTLGIDKIKKISELTEQEIQKISEFVKNPKLPGFILNRKKDFETGEDKHLSGSDVDLRREFDIKRLRKIRSYKGLRHALGQPVRGQRTKSHFRKGKALGVKRGKVKRSGK